MHINAYQRNQGSLRIYIYNLRVPTQNGHRIQKSFEICGIRDSDSNIVNFIILLHPSPLRLQEPTLISTSFAPNAKTLCQQRNGEGRIINIRNILRCMRYLFSNSPNSYIIDILHVQCRPTRSGNRFQIV